MRDETRLEAVDDGVDNHSTANTFTNLGDDFFQDRLEWEREGGGERQERERKRERENYPSETSKRYLFTSKNASIWEVILHVYMYKNLEGTCKLLKSTCMCTIPPSSVNFEHFFIILLQYLHCTCAYPSSPQLPCEPHTVVSTQCQGHRDECSRAGQDAGWPMCSVHGPCSTGREETHVYSLDVIAAMCHTRTYIIVILGTNISDDLYRLTLQ